MYSKFYFSVLKVFMSSLRIHHLCQRIIIFIDLKMSSFYLYHFFTPERLNYNISYNELGGDEFSLVFICLEVTGFALCLNDTYCEERVLAWPGSGGA